jgi:hypothetical protein
LAIQSYRQSLAQLEEGVGNRAYLTIKLEALGAAVDANTDGNDGGDM